MRLQPVRRGPKEEACTDGTESVAEGREGMLGPDSSEEETECTDCERTFFSI